mmetsp:Transcript_2095/g.3714  ORF Transcript_2095/g.3714 Transcript_2095/m.3714 type:complete len:254 (-) Transcript_2095:101-862(-)|eukprot:CAMPEP_0201888434 /NCGR_PEP_ID=MMETSP0902-20130614/27600_1 /ASSEMBLY_ACC=CAM_ASM_000551 /TAXON_ID=420261 /ORGANISM="Thalassiosira antarctica, Strain CCMP982" /LENGTH=253 /DNA_ID=CAMNT_0048418683 /DNA_START=21 /DNA_END=782 /DNA_ORIENTATION=+
MAIIAPARPSSPSPVGGGATEDAIMKSDADLIRSRLLYKLGIYDSNFTNASIYHKIRCERALRNRRSSTRPGSLIEADSKKKSQRQQQKQNRQHPSSSQEESQDTDSGLAPYFEPLKFREDLQSSDGNSPHHIPSNPSSSFSEEDGPPSEPPASMNESKSRQRSVFIDPSVAVISIPSHRSYSPRMHAQLYIPQGELAFAVVRNTREFVYEGWDWHDVIEEDRMYTSKASGEFIHPAHVHVAVGYKRMKNPYL